MKAELGTFPKDRQILYRILPIDTPLAVDIHITHHCNFHCNYCILSQPDEDFEKSGMKRDVMTWDMFKTVVSQLQEFPSKNKMTTLSGMGEVTLHPRLPDMIQLLYDAEVTEKIQVISNAALLTPELSRKLIGAGLGELKISLQGLSAKKYWDVSRVKIDWDNFYENIKYFSSIRGNCALKVKVADIALEEGEDEKFYALFGDICDAVSIEHIYDVWAVNNARLDYREKKTEKTLYGLEPVDVKICRFVFTNIDILPDGMYTTFCHVHFGHEKNITEVPIVEQWNSLGQNKVRLNMLKGLKDSYNTCKKCSIIHNSYHPEDLLMGHEAEILERMRKRYDIEDLL